MTARHRLDTLRPGTRFTPPFGGHYTLTRQHGAHAGVYCATRSNGEETSFAGFVEVELGWLKEGWLEKGWDAVDREKREQGGSPTEGGGAP